MPQPNKNRKPKPSVKNLAQLDDENYSSWLTRMRVYLKSRGLWETCITPPENPPFSIKQSQARHEAAQLIIAHLSDPVLDAIVTVEIESNPFELWTRISTRYATPSISNKARTWSKFMRYEYTGNMKEYIAVCHRMLKEASTIKLGIPNDLLSISILAKLTQELWDASDRLLSDEQLLSNPSATLTKLQDLICVKKDATPIENLGSAAQGKMKSEMSLTINGSSLLTLDPKPTNSGSPRCIPGQHHPRAQHPIWKCYKLSEEERQANRPGDHSPPIIARCGIAIAVPQGSLSGKPSKPVVLSFLGELGYSLRENYRIEHKATIKEVSYYPRGAPSSLLMGHPNARAICIMNPEIMMPEYQMLSQQVVDYVRNGGTAILTGFFSSFAEFPTFDRWLREAWGLPWKTGSYTSSEVALQRHASGLAQHPSRRKGLVNSYYCKALFLQNVAPQDSWYVQDFELDEDDEYDDEEYFHEHPAMPEPETSVAFGKCGKGWLGYTGSVNGDEETKLAVLSMMNLNVD